MSRSNIANIEDRRPFYLYVDEFQNFATDSFATILSEARKYGLNLTVANQYISQMSDTVRNAVFGNVGTMVSFRVSADDAPILSKQFEPQFEPGDLLQMNNRHFIINMVINGEKAPAFSATTLTLPPQQIDNTGRIVENTRRNFSRLRADIEKEIDKVVSSSIQKQPQNKPSPSTKNNAKNNTNSNNTKTNNNNAMKAGKVAVEGLAIANEGNSNPSTKKASATSSTAATPTNPPKKRRRSRPRKRTSIKNSPSDSEFIEIPKA